jgi:hypothetical protein
MITNKLTSKSLDQILEVIRKSKTNYFNGSPLHTSIQIAIDYVSKTYGVTYQTIEDGCRRRLGLKTIDDFRRVLSEYFSGNSDNIKSILREHTDIALHNKINEFLKGSVTSIKKTGDKIQHQPLPEQTTEVFSFRLDEETSKKLRLLLGYLGISPSEWISNNIRKKVNEDLQELLKSLVEKK